MNVPEEWLAHAPTNLSLEEEAGAIPLISLTAFQVSTWTYLVSS